MSMMEYPHYRTKQMTVYGCSVDKISFSCKYRARETFSEIDKKAREIKIHREPHGERFFILHRTLKRFREIRVRIRERFKRFKRFKREREPRENQEGFTK